MTTPAEDRAKLEMMQKELQNKEQEKADKKSLEDVEAALAAGGISCCNGKFIIPRVSACTLYLLAKIKSPFAVKDDGTQRSGELVMASQEDIIEALFILMSQDDPRIVEQIADRLAFDKAIYNLTKQIELEEIDELTEAIVEQFAKVNEAVKEEDLGDSKNLGPAPSNGS